MHRLARGHDPPRHHDLLCRSPFRPIVFAAKVLFVSVRDSVGVTIARESRWWLMVSSSTTHQTPWLARVGHSLFLFLKITFQHPLSLLLLFSRHFSTLTSLATSGRIGQEGGGGSQSVVFTEQQGH
jgi:hypothetical protein